MNSTVFGSWIAITELAGKPASMKCAANADMARSARAKVRRLGGWPGMGCFLGGSSNASASGCRARIRRNSPSSVGDMLVWITRSLRLQELGLQELGLNEPGLTDRPLPPRFREISGQGGSLRPFYPIPSGDPLLLNVKYRDSVEARHQGPVQRTHRRNKRGMFPRRQHGRDHGIDGRVFGAHVVSRTLIIRSLAAPIKELFIARRQRLIQAILDHVEIETEAALIELNGIDRAHRRRDTRALQIARVCQRDSLLIAGGHQNFEGEGRFGRALPQYGVIEIVTGLGQQMQRSGQGGSIAAGAIADREAVTAVENVGRDIRREGLQKFAFAVVSGTAIGR